MSSAALMARQKETRRSGLMSRIDTGRCYFAAPSILRRRAREATASAEMYKAADAGVDIGVGPTKDAKEAVAAESFENSKGTVPSREGSQKK